MSEVRIRDLVRHLDDAFPFAWAEPWDRVGLLVGDPDAVVTSVLVTLDPTPEAVERAAAQGANVLVTHHPAFLEPPASLTPAAAGAAFLAASRGLALVACHTNLDRAPEGAAALPLAVGLDAGSALERSREPVSLVTVYVPDGDAARVTEAMAAAGAGRIGDYRGCSFSGLGVGRFLPGPGTAPVAGTAGEPSSAEEVRLEMVCAPDTSGRVVAAARAAHPYEEPLIVVTDAGIDRGVARLGRVSRLDQPLPLRALAERVAEALSVMPRVWGPAERPMEVVATLAGGGGSAIGEAVAAGASVLLTGEVRYHSALEALSRGLCVIEAGHDVTEWPLVPVIAAAVESHPGLAGRVVRDDPKRHWWVP